MVPFFFFLSSCCLFLLCNFPVWLALGSKTCDKGGKHPGKSLSALQSPFKFSLLFPIHLPAAIYSSEFLSTVFLLSRVLVLIGLKDGAYSVLARSGRFYCKHQAICVALTLSLLPTFHARSVTDSSAVWRGGHTGHGRLRGKAVRGPRTEREKILL